MSITLLLQLLAGIAGAVPAFLNSEGIISSGLEKLFDASVAAVETIIAAIKGGGTVTSESLAVLTALQAEYTAVRQNTSADPDVIGAIAEVSNLLSDGITGFTNASTGGIDPSTLPVPPPVA